MLGVADVAVPPFVTGTPGDERERAVLAAAATLPDAPVAVDGAATVAVVGSSAVAASFARAVAIGALRAGGVATAPAVLERAAGASADLVVVIEPDGSARVAHASGPAADLPVRGFTPSLVTGSAAGRVLQGGSGGLALAALLADPSQDVGLRARFLLDADGPLELDLAADGPHAVVVGTTGSGKSALLTAWILALAAAHPPSALTLLLVDCKGGAAFDPLAALPHVAGVVTDLDADGTERAVVSLGAELRRRERALRAAGVPDAAAAGLPRLVVVVDEYRALLESRSALADLFADVAARGRSLGVHLVLCSQRAAGAMRDDLLANCGLRISLRVHDSGDSTAVVGTDQAARLGREPVGAAVLKVAGERTRAVRVAGVDPGRVAEAVAAAAGQGAVAAPWLPALPERLELPAAAGGLVPLGRLDLPAEQRQPVLGWDAARRPRLLIVGDPGSGRTGALAAAAHGLGAAAVHPSPAACWDALHDDRSPLLIDDLDHVLDRLGAAHASEAIDRLAARLRAPDAAPTVVALRGPGAWSGLPLRALVGLFDEVLVLSLGLDDHLGVGGERRSWSARLPPGAGWWRGQRAQIGVAPPLGFRPQQAVPPLPEGTVVLLTTDPAERSGRLAAAGRAVLDPDASPAPAAGAVLVGSPAAWQARWRALGRLAQQLPVVVDAVPAAEVRALLGRAVALPPLDDRDDAVLVPTEGAPRRVRLP